ncbi:MAG: glucosaminidase domain-containing protein [Spirochaetaceae bacterium]|nr:glucosaminidase domain-containing protein [Spirochaetaceae bacterium]
MKRCCFFITLCISISLVLFSCVSSIGTIPPQETLSINRKIAAKGIKTPEQLATFFISMNPKADYDQVNRLANYYVQEAEYEGINSDVAFVQMCLETGFLRFGGLVTADMHNYCGLGAIDEQNPGERFATEQLGVKAHIQHLHAYGTTTTLRGELIDRRYKYVNPRGKAPDIQGLAGTWAADPNYGNKLENLLQKLEEF